MRDKEFEKWERVYENLLAPWYGWLYAWQEFCFSGVQMGYEVISAVQDQHEICKEASKQWCNWSGKTMNPDCHCGSKMLRFQWYEIDPDYKYFYCLECDKAGRTPFLRAQFKGEWM